MKKLLLTLNDETYLKMKEIMERDLNLYPTMAQTIRSAIHNLHKKRCKK